MLLIGVVGMEQGSGYILEIGEEREKADWNSISLLRDLLLW